MANTADVESAAQLPSFQAASWRTSVLRAFRKNPVGAFAGLVCVMLVVLAVVGPSVAPHDPNDTSLPRLTAPSFSYPFGTDNLFRDLFSRIIFGSRNSLGIGFASVGVSLFLGVCLGVASGYLRGTWDAVVGSMVNVMFSYPSLVLVIFLITIFGQKFLVISVAIGLILTPYTIRVVRSATLQVSSLQYIEAAMAVGNSSFRIMYRHILPNVMPYVIVVASVNIGLAILIEASVSFLGLGVSSDTNPSWAGCCRRRATSGSRRGGRPSSPEQRSVWPWSPSTSSATPCATGWTPG